MPLPTDTILGLMGFSRPGETSQSRPKQAMLIRMSDKTLDLLESSPQLHFDFSESPGITIGDTFFPVNPVAETTPHEIYLRTSSQAKPNAPLKLYANVTGRFAVERQLDDRISDKVRNSNLDAQNQRAGRTTIFVKTPTDLPPPNGKKKEGAASTMFRKPLRPADRPRRSLPATNAVASVNTTSAPQPSQRSKEALQALRNRMIPCICTSQRTSEQIVKLVGGNNSSTATRQDILKLLDEIAEPTPLPTNSKSPKTYRLKTESWREVRPYEIPGLSETERTNLARSAKYALRDLKIPESDPAWSHVQYRNPNGASSSSASRKQLPNAASSSRTGQAPEPKRGITSGAAKDKKTKAKDSGEIMMKNESLKASNSKPPTNSSIQDDDSGKSLPFKPPATRRPGSGFKAKQPTPTESREFASGRSPVINGKAVLGEPSNSPQNKISGSTPTAERRTAGMPSHKINKLRKDGAAVSDSERSDVGRERERVKATKGKDRVKEVKERERRELVNERERERERDKRELERQRERERAKKREGDHMDGDRERIKKRARDTGRLQEREEGEHSDDSFRQQKRKKASREDNGIEASRASIKKRKLGPPLRDVKVEELSLPKKPDTEPIQQHINHQKESSPLPPIPKIKKEASPLVPLAKIKKEPSPLTSLPKIKKETTPALKISSPVTKVSPSASTSSTQVATSKQKVSTKRRRGSDIYTSSEDEGEIRQGAKREPVSHPMVNNNLVTHANKPPPAHDRAALRNHYDSSYLPYLDKFQVLMSQKPKLRNLLKKVETSGSDSVTESEGDGGLLEPEELRKLALEYQDQHEDLENILRIYSKRDDRSEM